MKHLVLKTVLGTLIVLGLFIGIIFLGTGFDAVIIILSLAVVVQVILYLQGSYFIASLFALDMTAVLLPVVFFFLGFNNLHYFGLSLIVFFIFSLLFVVSVTERSEIKVKIYRELRNVIALIISWGFIFSISTLFVFFFFHLFFK